MLFTAVVAAIYRKAETRAFWLGFFLFGWGFYVLCWDVSFEFRSSSHSRNRYYWVNGEEEVPPIRAFTKGLVDYLQLNRKTVPKSVAEKVQVQWGGGSNSYPSSVLEIKGNKYKIRYDGDSVGTWDEWVGTDRIKLEDLDRSYRIGELLFVLLFALAGAFIARWMYATRKTNDPDDQPHRQGVP